MLNLGQIQGKLALVRVSGEFELSEFELAGFYCTFDEVDEGSKWWLKALVFLCYNYQISNRLSNINHAVLVYKLKTVLCKIFKKWVGS